MLKERLPEAEEYAMNILEQANAMLSDAAAGADLMSAQMNANIELDDIVTKLKNNAMSYKDSSDTTKIPEIDQIIEAAG